MNKRNKFRSSRVRRGNYPHRQVQNHTPDSVVSIIPSRVTGIGSGKCLAWGAGITGTGMRRGWGNYQHRLANQSRMQKS
jgi:hypothetical protein